MKRERRARHRFSREIEAARIRVQKEPRVFFISLIARTAARDVRQVVEH